MQTPTPLSPNRIPAHVTGACRALRSAGYAAWLVGGSVRDLLSGRAAKDWDIATSATPPEVRRVFGNAFTIPTGEKHGTITVLVNRPDGTREPIEVTTFRGEGAYSDGRRPDEVSFVTSLTEDLKRRDFTVNAIAYDPLDDVVSDPFGGQRDLGANVLRAVGDPLERFGEDGLRAMRAVRFCAQHGFALDPPTALAIPQTLDVFRKVSAERMRDELVKILDSARPALGVTLLLKTQLCSVVLPELVEGVGLHQNHYHAFDVWGHNVAALDAAERQSVLGPTWVLRAAALLHDVGKPRCAAPKPDAPAENTFYNHEIIGAEMADSLLRRLKFSNAEREHLCALIRHHMWCYSPEWTDGAVRRFMMRVGPEALPDLFALRRADVIGKGHGDNPDDELQEITMRVARERERQSALTTSDLAITGRDVMASLALAPGPEIGRILRALLERVVDDKVGNEREGLLAAAVEIHREGPGGTAT